MACGTSGPSQLTDSRQNWLAARYSGRAPPVGHRCLPHERPPVAPANPHGGACREGCAAPECWAEAGVARTARAGRGVRRWRLARRWRTGRAARVREPRSGGTAPPRAARPRTVSESASAKAADGVVVSDPTPPSASRRINVGPTLTRFSAVPGRSTSTFSRTRLAQRNTPVESSQDRKELAYCTTPRRGESRQREPGVAQTIRRAESVSRCRSRRSSRRASGRQR